MKPKIDIDVDEITGVWQSDGLPMLYIPRHFMVNVHDAVEAALGLERYKTVLHEAGSKSAYYWCRQQAGARYVSGVDVFEHYLQRLSARGWGQFRLEEFDLEHNRAAIVLENSIYVLTRPDNAPHPVCYMFEGFFTGGIKYLIEESGLAQATVICREVQCQAMGFECCKFEADVRTTKHN